MISQSYTFPVVLAWTTQYILNEVPDTDLFMHDLDNGEIINVFQDSEGEIQICIYEDTQDQEPLDGGGCVTMDDLPVNLSDLTPEQLTQLITDKALFIWDLCHER